MSFLPSLNFGSRSSKTFKPKKNIPEGSHQHDLMKHAAATLGSGNLRLAVMLPEGVIYLILKFLVIFLNYSCFICYTPLFINYRRGSERMGCS